MTPCETVDEIEFQRVSEDYANDYWIVLNPYALIESKRMDQIVSRFLLSHGYVGYHWKKGDILAAWKD